MIDSAAEALSDILCNVLIYMLFVFTILLTYSFQFSESDQL